MDDCSLFSFGGDDVAAGVYNLGELCFGVDRLAEVAEDAGGEDVEWNFRDISLVRIA